ncbi:MAG: hypothetical protein L6243_05430 [Candidatus Altiarchaeales archaeon]|nr:hypothetical protein [Candidatus Altiarchaeota archaeon]MBU4342006.1 hypothetical protein [Candidatus Altiarchaeota archaeon]MBU4437157.1 hypothetical protein [Candidatus Altiarchaeota archaeon]MCG2783013.1 hypothetical protein [Candidatus Altiarchaeales archaeon]
MKAPNARTNANYQQEFEELTEDLSSAIDDMGDPVAIGTMLYSIAEEKKSNNLIVRDINAKFDNIAETLDKIYEKLSVLTEQGISRQVENPSVAISERDEEILNFVKSNGKACADDVQSKFEYKGRNAASARLSRLFKDSLLEKVYHGRKVYYVAKS